VFSETNKRAFPVFIQSERSYKKLLPGRPYPVALLFFFVKKIFFFVKKKLQFEL
jgi:hypothetical protein